MTAFEVWVSNIGMVYRGIDHGLAIKTFHEYVNISNRHLQGRVSGESVVLFRDGEPIAEYKGEGIEPL